MLCVIVSWASCPLDSCPPNQRQLCGQSEFPTNETLVGFGDSSGVGFEKVDGLYLFFNVAMDIWISKLDFHMYPQQPHKLSNQNEVWKSSKSPPLCDSTLIFLLFCLEPPNQNIAKNSAQCTYLVKSVLKYHSCYVMRWYIEKKNQNFHIIVDFRLCSNLEVPEPPIQTIIDGHSGAFLDTRMTINYGLNWRTIREVVENTCGSPILISKYPQLHSKSRKGHLLFQNPLQRPHQC